jgi:IclR family transcriptional regulator, pca regulon regulatory protein
MEGDPKSMVASLAKGLRVLEAFSAERPLLKNTDVARMTGLDHGTVFRLLQTLVMLGYVERLPETRAFRLTLKVLDLGFAAIGRLDLRGAAQPELRLLVQQLGEAASLGVLDGDEVVYVERIQDSDLRLGVDIRVGSRVSAPVTAIGQAILAWLPAEDAARVFAARARDTAGAPAPHSVAELVVVLGEVRGRGYAIAEGNTVSGLRVLAAPVLGADGSAVAAISVASPSIRCPLQEHVARAGPALLQAASRIGRALAASGQTIAARPHTR